jgi:PAS domain S-box-containing protein
MKLKPRLNRKVQFAFGSAILALLTVGAISYHGMVMFSESGRWVRHADEVLANLQDLLLSLKSMDASARGFRLAGNASYLVSLHASELKARQDEAIIGDLTVDNPVQQRAMTVLKGLVAQKVQSVEMGVEPTRKDSQAVQDILRGGGGEQIGDELQEVLRNMRDEELRLLMLREADLKRRLGQTKAALILGTILGMSIAGAAGWSAQRDNSARDLAEQALHQEEERFRDLANNMSQFAWMADAKGWVSWYNQQWFDYTGTTLEETVGSGWRKVHHPEHVQRVVEKISRCFETGEVWEDTFPLRGRDGSYRWFLSRAVPIRNPAGKVLRWFGTETDISANREAEKHLAQMEGRYRGLLEAAPDAMVVVDQRGEIVLLNVQAEKQFGYRRDELVGQKVKNIIPEGFAERLIADETRSVEQALAQHIGTGIELSGRRKKGSEFPIEIMLSPLESAEGTLVTAAIRDISVRKDVEKHLAQMEGRYRGLLEAAPDAMVVVDQRGEIVLLNVQAEKQFGYRRDELVGQKVKNIIPEGFAERLIADETRSVEQALAQHIGTGIELSGRRKNGSEFPIEIMLSPLESAEGTLVTAAIRDISVRKDAEKHLAQMEGRYRGLLEAAPDAMVVVDQCGEIVLLNVQAEKQFGYRRDELVGQKVKNIIPEGFAERLIADGTRSVEQALAQQIGTGIELSGRRKNGSEFPIEIMLSPLESAEGTLVTAAIRDISVRKDADKHLAQMEGRYRGLLEAAPDAMVVVNQRGEIVLLNVQAEKQFGYRRDELVGQKVKNIIPEGFAERLIADGTRSVEQALAQQIGTGIELSGRRKNGSEFPIEIMLSPLKSAEGTLVTAAIRDISVRKDAEKHLAQMEGRYRGLLEAAPDAMVVVDQRGEIVLLNVQAEKQFGYSRDELVGQKVKNIVPEGFAERLVSDALRSVEDALAQQIGTGIELNGRRKNGSSFPIEIMLSPLESAEGILVTAAIRDISVRRNAEGDLLRKVEELNRSNEELGQFAYIASHDLQEPLRMVASYTQLLSRRYKGKLDAEADEFIAFAVDGASRMQRLIQDLLAYSRVGTKGMELLRSSSEEALQQALINLRGAIEESGALVTHDPLPAVLADKMQLIQLFQNLVGNAIKYQNPGIPRVHISAAGGGGKQWTFSVRDNGLGIDPLYFERIFGMFQRLHKREEFAGTGIGLAICKKIVERHGGSISVESQPGQGSTFRFALATTREEAMKAFGG